MPWRHRNLRPATGKSVIFFRAGSMTELLLQTCVNAVYAASFMALIAVGLMLIFGVMGVVNFAHGELFHARRLLRPCFVYADREFSVLPRGDDRGSSSSGSSELRWSGALFRPVRGQSARGGSSPPSALLLMLQGGDRHGGSGLRMEHIVAPQQMTFPPLRARGRGGRGPAPLRHHRGGAIVLTSLWVFLRRTHFGWALRALRAGSGGSFAAGDLDQPDGPGAPPSRCSSRPRWRGLAGGPSRRPLVRTYPYMGALRHRHRLHRPPSSGGSGSLGGAVVAAILYGFVHTFVTTFSDGVVADIVGLLLMLIVLIVRPTGLLGVRERDWTAQASGNRSGAQCRWGATGTAGGYRGRPLPRSSRGLIVLPHVLSFSQKEVAVFPRPSTSWWWVSYRLLTLTGEWVARAHGDRGGSGAYASTLIAKRLGVPVPIAMPLGAGPSPPLTAYVLSFPLFRMKGPSTSSSGSFAAGGGDPALLEAVPRAPSAGPKGHQAHPLLPGHRPRGSSTSRSSTRSTTTTCVWRWSPPSIVILSRFETIPHRASPSTRSTGRTSSRRRSGVDYPPIPDPRLRHRPRFFAGLAGALLAHYLGTVNPNQFRRRGDGLRARVGHRGGETATVYGPILGVVTLTVVERDRAPGARGSTRPVRSSTARSSSRSILFLPDGLREPGPRSSGGPSPGPGETLFARTARPADARDRPGREVWPAGRVFRRRGRRGARARSRGGRRPGPCRGPPSRSRARRRSRRG